MTRKPGDKGPMGEDAHTDKGADTSAQHSGRLGKQGREENLDEDLEESFPASDAPADTQSKRTK